MTDEEYVRSRLEDVYWDKRFYNNQGDVVHLGWSICAAETEEEGWKLAVAWTRTREEEIRLVEEEIAELHEEFDWSHPENNYTHEATLTYAIFQRILAREQAALAELRRGMKERQ